MRQKTESHHMARSTNNALRGSFFVNKGSIASGDESHRVNRESLREHGCKAAAIQ